MLSEREQRILDELERSYADTVAAARGTRPRRLWLGERPWALLVAGFVALGSAFLIIAGAGSGGPALAVAGALGWSLWYLWPWLRDQGVVRPCRPEGTEQGRAHPWLLQFLARLPDESAIREERSMPTDQILDVRDEAPAQRHALILGTYGDLPPGAGFVLVNDHDPKPLYYQFDAEHKGDFTWDYLEQGPEVWRVRIGRPVA